MEETPNTQSPIAAKAPKMKGRWWLLLAVGGLLIVAGLVIALLRPSEADQPAEAAGTIVIERDNLTPVTIAIQKGQAVTWTNQDSKPHGLVSDTLPGLNTSQPMQAGESYTYTFEKSGQYHYYDPANTKLTGTVIVE